MTEPTDDECVAWFKCRSVGESFNEEDWRAREILFSELARLTKLVVERGWRPIEEAPEGTHSFLVWCPERQNIYVVTRSWGFKADELPFRHFSAMGGPLLEIPTHYRPLPPAPLPSDSTS